MLPATLQRLSRIGLADQGARKQRRIVLVNLGSAIGACTAFAYVCGYAIAGLRTFWVGAAINAAALALYGLPIALNGLRRHRLASGVLLASANAHVLFAALFLGRAVGFHDYFFLLAPLALLVLAQSERAVLATFTMLPLALYCFIQYGYAGAWVAMAPGSATLLNAAVAITTFCTLMLVVYLFAMEADRWERLLAAESERSERLLLNILPASISRRLKQGDETIADGYAEVSVLFADIVGFTELSARLGPAEIVRVLNRIFSEFDALLERFPAEKIKTIGDAYMVASGLPEANPRHAEVIADLALEMRATIARIARETTYPLDVRIGVHSGPVVAGVIGRRKFIYDLWGDTVNTASRMESHGVPGGIQVTEAVKARLDRTYLLEPRGQINVKGKGAMPTWLLTGRVEGAVSEPELGAKQRQSG